MSFLDRLSEFEDENMTDVEIAPTSFEMQQSDEDDSYVVMKGNVPCCKVEFVDNRNDSSVDVDTAQRRPDQHTVYVSDVLDEKDTQEYLNKLEDMGFDKVSVVQMESEKLIEMAQLKPDFISDDGRLAYKLIKDREWGEWMAKAYIDGQFNDYKTARDSDDAEGKNQVIYSAKAGIEIWNKMTDEQKEEAIADAIKFDKETA